MGEAVSFSPKTQQINNKDCKIFRTINQYNKQVRFTY